MKPEIIADKRIPKEMTPKTIVNVRTKIPTALINTLTIKFVKKVGRVTVSSFASLLQGEKSVSNRISIEKKLNTNHNKLLATRLKSIRARV